MKTSAEWLAYLGQEYSPTGEITLHHCAQAARRLGIGNFACPVITVAGTNGKGTTVALLTEYYWTAGYRVATYTSPHLLRFHERICFNKQPIDEAALCAVFEQVEQGREDIPLTYFEFVTLAALLYFHQCQPDIVILEVGLGGRLDAVNIIDPDIAVITSIDFDHCARLGNDLASIAREKAGIMRSLRPVVCGCDTLLPTLVATAKQLNAPLYYLQRDFSTQLHDTTWDWLSGTKQITTLPIPAIPLTNAAATLMVVELLQSVLPVSLEALQKALAKIQVPGRCQRGHYKGIPYLLDVAHNPQSARYLASTLMRHAVSQRHAVMGMMADKDLFNTLSPLQEVISRWTVAPLATPRAASASQLREVIKQFSKAPILEQPTITAAFEQAISTTLPQDEVVVFGSFYAVAPILELISDVKVVTR